MGHVTLLVGRFVMLHTFCKIAIDSGLTLTYHRRTSVNPRPRVVVPSHPYHPSRRCEGAAIICCYATERTWLSTRFRPSSPGPAGAETVSSGIIAHRPRQPRRRRPPHHDPDDCGAPPAIATARTTCSGTRRFSDAGSCGDEPCPARQEPGRSASRAPRSRHRCRASTGVPAFHPRSASPWFGGGRGHRQHTARP